MPSLDQLEVGASIFALFIGKSGSGKTCAAASFPGPIKFLDFDGRIRGILGANWIDRKGLGEVIQFPPDPKKPTYIKVSEIIETDLAFCNMGKYPFKTLVLGSLTAQTFSFLSDAKAITHAGNKGKSLGKLPMAGPEDYGFEATGTYQMLAGLRSLYEHPNGPKNVIIDAHIVDKWGKPIKDNGDTDTYAASEVVGEKLSLRDKISENVQIYFDHVWRFDSRMVGNEPHHYVSFRTDLARTSFANLPNGQVDITGKPFYQELKRLAGF